MRMIKCPQCKKEISSTEKTCPYCGKLILGYYKMTPLTQKIFKALIITASVLFILLVVASCFPEKKIESVQKIQTENIKPTPTATALQKIDPSPYKKALKNISTKIVGNKYGEVTIDLELEKDIYRVWFVYDKDPMPMKTAEKLSRAGVKSIIDILLKQGQDPSKEWISIYARVHTNIAQKSVTGKKQVRTYGVASYDWESDRIDWKPAK